MTAILFDLDGTLMDHGAAQRTAAQIFCRKCHERGFKRSDEEEFLVAWRKAEQTYFGQYLAGSLSFQEQRRRRVCDVLEAELDGGTADALFLIYLEAYEASWRAFPDVGECLKELQPLRVGVVSNGDGYQQRRKLERLGFAGAFDPVVISGDIGVAKPEAEIFLEACRLAAAEPRRTVYVGDRSDTDAIAASEAGLVGVWLNRQRAPAPKACPYQIHSLLELPRIVELVP